MQSTNPSTSHTASAAVAEIDDLIAQHRAASRRVAVWVGGAFACLIVAAVVIHWIDTYRATAVLTAFNEAAERITQASSSAASAPVMDAQMLLSQVRPRVEAIAQHAQTFGVSYYNAVILSGGAVFALIFAVLMSIYRHHLTEISKLQHARLAFTRVRVAMSSAPEGQVQLLVQAALLERAFEYRSGKEKLTDSPIPGHPVSDTSALVVDKLLEALAKRESK